MRAAVVRLSCVQMTSGNILGRHPPDDWPVETASCVSWLSRIDRIGTLGENLSSTTSVVGQKLTLLK